MAKFLEIEVNQDRGKSFFQRKYLLNLDSIEYVFDSNFKVEFDDGSSCVVLCQIILKGKYDQHFALNLTKPYSDMVKQIKELTC
jgi:hypothetical protein